MTEVVVVAGDDDANDDDYDDDLHDDAHDYYSFLDITEAELVPVVPSIRR